MESLQSFVCGLKEEINSQLSTHGLSGLRINQAGAGDALTSVHSPCAELTLDQWTVLIPAVLRVHLSVPRCLQLISRLSGSLTAVWGPSTASAGCSSEVESAVMARSCSSRKIQHFFPHWLGINSVYLCSRTGGGSLSAVRSWWNNLLCSLDHRQRRDFQL